MARRGISSLAIAGLALVAASARADSRAQAAPIGPAASPFGEWTALGSGCRGGAAGGDVAAEFVPARGGGSWRARFHLDSFHLSTAERADGAPLTFARECGVRIVVAPPPGMRVTVLAAEARVAARKTDGAKLTLSADLRVGPEAVASRVITYDAAGDRAGDEAFTLAPGSPSPLPLACGEARVAALDLTWIVTRAAAREAAQVAMGGERTADVIVRLEPC